MSRGWGKRIAIRGVLVVVGVSLGLVARWYLGPPPDGEVRPVFRPIPAELEHIGRDLQHVSDGEIIDLPLPKPDN